MTMQPLLGWRLRADGQRIEPVLILDFVALPVPINGEPVMAVYASLEGDALQGRVGYDYAGAFEVDVAPRAVVLPTAPRPNLWGRVSTWAWGPPR